jgi:basic membrane protein A
MRAVSGASRPESSLGGNARKCEARLQPLSSTRFGNAGDACEGGHSLATKVEVNLRNNATSLSLAALFAAAALAATTAPASAFLACAVTDVGGVDDKGFNQYTWQGVQDAAKEGGFEAKLLESKAETDYVPNINSFISGGCNVIVTVGFLLGDATKASATANANQKYAIVDFAYDPPLPNVLGLTFSTDQAAFLAGYVAAGMSKTHKLGTFGGQKIPTVTIFMDGFWAGMKYYNQKNNANVQLVGWDAVKQNGLFTGDFTNQDNGKRVTETLLSQGADIILPVAGPVGLGAAAAVKSAGADKHMIWVDTDGCESAQQYCSLFLTSIEKKMDVAVQSAIKSAVDNQFKGGTYVGTLENDGVGIAPFHDFESQVPQKIKDDVETIKQGIVSGSISVKPQDYA